MRFITVLMLGICLFFVSCSSNSKKQETSVENKTDSINGDNSKTVLLPNEFLITGKKFSKIDSSVDYSQLQKLYGAGNVTDTIDFGPEGSDTMHITKIFSNTPREITVYWKLNKFHQQISAAECYGENAPYYTSDSLKVGSSLLQLLKANGKKIDFYGAGWDYGGLITSYNQGKFESSAIFFQLSDKPGMNPKLMGDQKLNTEMPLVKGNLQKIVIAKISVSFEKNAK